jgi:hypothetical protein
MWIANKYVCKVYNKMVILQGFLAGNRFGLNIGAIMQLNLKSVKSNIYSMDGQINKNPSNEG